MKELLAFASIIILATKCLSIRLLLNNVSTSNTRFCVGDRLSIICTIDDNAYQWNVDFPDNSKNSEIISVGQASVNSGPFTFYVVTNPYSGNSAYLEVVAYRDLDSSISCEGKEKSIGQSQAVDLRIAGESTRPQIAAEVTSDQQSIIITITPGDVCENDYRVTLVESGRKRLSTRLRVVTSDIVVKNVKELFPKLTVNLCKHIYYLTLSSANKKYTTNTIKVKANYAGFGSIENFVIGQNNIHWTIPDNVSAKGCFDEYRYTLKMSDHSGSLPFKNSHSRKDISRFVSSPCGADILSVVPVSAATQQPLPSNGASGTIILDKTLENPLKMKPRTHGMGMEFQFGLENCPDTTIVASIRDDQSVLNEVLIPTSRKSFEFTGLVPNTSYTCSFEITHELLGILHTEDVSCTTEQEPSTGAMLACGPGFLVILIAIISTSYQTFIVISSGV